MNKLVVDEVEFVAENIESILNVKTNDLCLTCKGKNKIIIESNEINNLKIVLLDNSYLDISIFNNNKIGLNELIIEQNNNTNIFYKESFSSKENCSTIIENVVHGDNNKSDIKIRCISYDNKCQIDILANVLKKTKNNEIIEDVKGINHGGFVEVKPNMEINTNEVMANHFVTISKISEEDLFYLESKGLSKEVSEKLILEGFLKSILINEQEFISEWR